MAGRYRRGVSQNQNIFAMLCPSEFVAFEVTRVDTTLARETMGAKQGRVLIIEPDVQAAEALHRSLTAADYEVVDVAATAEAALRMAAILKPDFYLLDPDLPDQSGLALIQDLKARHPAPVIMVARHVTLALIAEAVHAGADSYLTPTSKSDELTRVLAVARLQFLEKAQAKVEAEQQRHLTGVSQQQEALLRTFSDSSAQWEYWLTPSLDHLRYTNRTCEALTGYSPEELSATPHLLADMIHPDDRVLFAHHCEAVKAHPDKCAEINYRILTKGGEVRWLHHTCSLILEGGVPAGRRVTCQDISSQRELETRFRIIFSEAPIGMALVDLEGRFVEVNLSLCRMLGYTLEELRNKPFSTLTVSEDQEISLHYFNALIEGTMTSATFEKRYRRKDGRVIWVHLTTSVVHDEQRRPRYFITMMQDITARKEAEALVRLQSAALHAAANGIVITDRDGAILWANPALERMTGYKLEELRGQNPRIFKSGYQDRMFYQHLWDTILSGQVWHGELINRRRDGTLYHEELTITPLLDAMGAPESFIAVKQDITARKEAEQERERALRAEQEQRRRAEALVRASAALTSTLDLNALLRQILSAAIAAVPAAEKGSILLPEDEGGKALYIHTAVGYEHVNLRLLRFTRGYAVEAFRQKIPLVVPDVVSTYQIYPDIPEVGGLRSAIAVPLKVKQRVLGVLCLDNATRPNAFSAEDAALLESFAAQAALALENARMFAQVQQERETLHVLYTLSARLGEARTLQDVLATIMETRAHFGAESCELLLAGAPPLQLVGWDEHVTQKALDEEAWTQLTTRGVTGWVWQERQAAWVQDGQTDSRWEARPDLSEFPIRSALCVPLRQRDGQLRGLLSYYHREAEHFSAQQLGLIGEIGERVSSVLEALYLDAQQQRYLEQQRRLTVLASLLNRETELVALERAFLPVILELTAADAGTVALYDAQQRAFVQPYHHQLPAELHWETWPVDKGVTGRAVRSARGLIINAYEHQPEAQPEWIQSQLRSGITVPLFMENELVGLLECYRFENPRPFTEDELNLALYAAELFGVALQRARLYETAQKQSTWATALLEATTALSQHLELDRVLDLIMEQAERVVAGDAFNVMLLEDNPLYARVVRRRDRYGLRVVRDEVLHLSEFPLLQTMLETRMPVVVEDTAQDPRWKGETASVRAYLGAPILSGSRVLGFLNVNSQQSHRFTLDDMDRLRGFAAQVAIALENARLYHELQRHADTLEERVAERTATLNRRLRQQRLEAEVARDVNALDSVRDMLQRAVALIVERMDMYHATIFLVDEKEPQRLRRVASAGHAAEQILALDPELPITQGLVGTAVRTGASVRSLDVQRDPRHRYNPFLPETRSEIALPLQTAGGIIGVLDVQSRRPNAFDDDDALSLQILADQIALSYQRLRNAAQAQEQYARLQAVLQSTSDGILVADAAGNIQSYNAAVEAWLRDLRLEERTTFYVLVRDLAARASLHPQAEQRLGTRDLLFKAMPIQDHGEGEVVISIHDITELKRLDRMKTEFVSNVSHELRTPVTTILLYAALLKKAQGEEQQEYLDAIIAEAQRQASLVEDILTLSRFDAGRVTLRPRPLGLNALIESVMNSHRALALAGNITLKQNLSPDDVEVLGDAEKLTQVLNNLVENAIHYTPEGGEVVVSSGTERREGRVWGILRVQDTGIGIPLEELPHIFERFYRGSEPQKRQIQGTGLGLAIVAELVKLHEGQITVTSTPGAGSTFTVYLPLAQEAETPDAPNRPDQSMTDTMLTA